MRDNGVVANSYDFEYNYILIHIFALFNRRNFRLNKAKSLLNNRGSQNQYHLSPINNNNRCMNFTNFLDAYHVTLP